MTDHIEELALRAEERCPALTGTPWRGWMERKPSKRPCGSCPDCETARLLRAQQHFGHLLAMAVLQSDLFHPEPSLRVAADHFIHQECDRLEALLGGEDE